MKRRLIDRLADAWRAFRDDGSPPDGVAVRLTFWDGTPVIVWDPDLAPEKYDFVLEWMNATRTDRDGAVTCERTH